LVHLEKGQSASDQFTISEQPIRKSGCPFTLSWSRYVVLLTIKNADERSFYEIEATNAGWSVPELKRQKASCFYKRLALSRDKAGIRKLAREGQVMVRPEDMLKEPLVLEFLGLGEKASYSETDIEQAIINRLETLISTPLAICHDRTPFLTGPVFRRRSRSRELEYREDVATDP